MATITLTADTLISTLMPSGGGALASGDTIQLAGHSLIVDADAVDYPVTIANSGADANLELRDLSRIKLNATLPATVHPWIDPAHPLPADFEDEAQYITGLTANARAEIQLGNFSLGGGVAILPTKTRAGAFWAKSVAWPSATEVQFDRDLHLHAGDFLQRISIAAWNDLAERSVIVAYDSATYTATLAASPPNRTVGFVYAVVAGGVAISHAATGDKNILSSPMYVGTLNVVSDTNNWKTTGSALFAYRVAISSGTSNNMNGERGICLCGPASSVDAKQAAFYFAAKTGDQPNTCYSFSLKIGECAGSGIIKQFNNIGAHSQIKIESGEISWLPTQGFVNGIGFGKVFELGNIHFGQNLVAQSNNPKQAIEYHNVTFGTSEPIVETIVCDGGTVKAGANGWYYHAPATAADVTWRYTDRVVAPGATLRLRCAWKREGSAATRASVSVTDTATWWPQLWPLGAKALASVEFTGGTADWRSELLTWRNTSTEAATVRVWECVTGTVAGGHLKVEEVKGGQL